MTYLLLLELSLESCLLPFAIIGKTCLKSPPRRIGFPLKILDDASLFLKRIIFMSDLSKASKANLLVIFCSIHELRKFNRSETNNILIDEKIC